MSKYVEKIHGKLKLKKEYFKSKHFKDKLERYKKIIK